MWWPQIIGSMVKFDHKINAIVIKVVYFVFTVHVIKKVWKYKSLCKYIEETFTASQIFGPLNNNCHTIMVSNYSL